VKESRYNVWVASDTDHYVFNGSTGALMRMTAEERATVRALVGEAAPEPPIRQDFMADLQKARVVVPDSADELAALRSRYSAAAAATDHLGLTLVTSLGCNFDCPYCFEAKHPSLMDDEVEQAILRLLRDRAPGLRTMSVCWFGGEPLVGREPLFRLSRQFLEVCEEQDIRYLARIVTNGWLLDEATARQLRDHGVRLAQITLDGPPDVHDRMRPTRGGRGTFARILRNLHTAVDVLDVVIRINVDTQNLGRVEELLAILQSEGLSGRLSVSLGQLVGIDDDPDAPSASYRPTCLSNREFAKARLWLEQVKGAYGFASGASLPAPRSIPCTAVAGGDLVIGSTGEMYKCYEHVGYDGEVIGNVRDYLQTNSRVRKWLSYEPFGNPECRSCIALPVCMGGCAHHAMDRKLYANRCGDFRHTYREQVERCVAVAEGRMPPPVESPEQFLERPAGGRRLLPLSPV
jgi:uncharacterized protein